ncbi:G-box-binding factor-like isoform X1 [Wyeomyia smithii]|uniref:G-box-binding factor-like isoform X1 n=2 Tax=Wyeomyia smithii TaxID=174621 RepID=UPI0024681857|nr:G-box-binding factor-like isoform X1 [Wyeomyia smithii]XP_055544856.1 G-box-binding factor-like isoform X1 [Wyeomyia smithii]XP_055544857.1 G-box-binding factor-like isoform X1 [Wyeomyia smithii]
MTSSGYVTSANALNTLDKLPSSPLTPLLLPSSPPGLLLDVLNVTSSTVAIASPSQAPIVVTPAVMDGTEAAEEFVVLPGPEDVLLFNSTNGLYQQSVTLTARMYPIEATAAKSIWGLPTLIWAILIGTIVILIVILATLFFCCWLQPRTRKLLGSTYYTGSSVSHNSVVPKSQTSDSNQLVMPLSIGICPPQYSAPPPPTSSSSETSHTNSQGCQASSSGIPCHPAGGVKGGSNPSTAGHHSKYSSSPQYAHQYHQQQQQFQHHHQCIHHQQQQQQRQQQQQQQYHAHYAHLQQQQQQQQQCIQYQQPQQQTYQQYYNQQQQQHQQQQQQQQQMQHQHSQMTQYMHPAQQQALQQQQQQQREHQMQQQQHHYHQQHHHQPNQLVHHKSMWAINPLYASSGVINDGGTGVGRSGTGGGSGRHDNDDDAVGSTSYRTRSLPSWGKNKQRPLSNADDLEELYAKVNFSKKRRNRMRNDEAAIIALCRSRSQNLSSLPMADQDAVVIYDERTAL